jgi:hypothetical protein
MVRKDEKDFTTTKLAFVIRMEKNNPGTDGSSTI